MQGDNETALDFTAQITRLRNENAELKAKLQQFADYEVRVGTFDGQKRRVLVRAADKKIVEIIGPQKRSRPGPAGPKRKSARPDKSRKVMRK